MKCPYCSASPNPNPNPVGRCTTTTSGRCITECASCGRVISERQTQTHHLFPLRSHDSPLLLSTSDLPPPPKPDPDPNPDPDPDPFNPTGFITAFSTFSLEYSPLFALSSLSFSGHLSELERALDSPSGAGASLVVVDNLRAYLQIVDVASILGLEQEISEHAVELFRDCSSATCLRNRSVEALATACLVQAIREAQQPRTLQEISIAANLPQKEIGKYIKILGEALQLGQPFNSNSIAVHMPRFCNLLQLNKSAQELATHIGEVVMNKCFCTRRNPISISAAAIYLACQLEDRRKTQAEICKVTGLTEVTLRKVYKELLENWDDLLPSNYTPVVPPEKAFPTTTIASGRSTTPRAESMEIPNLDKERQPEGKQPKVNQVSEISHPEKGIGETEGSTHNANKVRTSWNLKGGVPYGTNIGKTSGDNQTFSQAMSSKIISSMQEASGRSTTAREETSEIANLDREKQPEGKQPKVNQVSEISHSEKGKGETEGSTPSTNKARWNWKGLDLLGVNIGKTSGDNQIFNQAMSSMLSSSMQEASGRSTTLRAELPEITNLDRERQPEGKQPKVNQVSEISHPEKSKGETEGSTPNANKVHTSWNWKHGVPFDTNSGKTSVDQIFSQAMSSKFSSSIQETDQKVISSMRPNPFAAMQVSNAISMTRTSPTSVQGSQSGQYQTTTGSSKPKEPGKHNEGRGYDAVKGK